MKKSKIYLDEDSIKEIKHYISVNVIEKIDSDQIRNLEDYHNELDFIKNKKIKNLKRKAEIYSSLCNIYKEIKK